RPSDRQVALFDCACARRIWSRLGESNHRVTEAKEQLADGRGTQESLAAATAEASPTVSTGAELSDLGVAYLLVAPAAFVALRVSHPRTEAGAQAALLRDIVGTPSRPASPPAGVPPAVVSLAQATYEHRILPSGELDLARLAVLADALEEGGCTDAG